MQSIIASLATAKFNQLMLSYNIERNAYDNCLFDSEDTLYSANDAVQAIDNAQLYQFDCKCWNVPTYNDVFAWILYRQNDCIKNSKQQTAQTYLPHKELLGKNTDEQIALLKETQGVDWYEFPNNKKYGRFIWKEEVRLVSDDGYHYTRHMWKTHDAYPLNDEHNREIFHSMNIIPKQ
jgi:hypothetical protein